MHFPSILSSHHLKYLEITHSVHKLDPLWNVLDEDEEEDEPITMGGKKLLPKIIETKASPNEKEIKQIESVL